MVLTGLAVLAGCASTKSTTHQEPSLLTRDQVITEYNTETRALKLPSGARWPDLPAEMKDDPPDYRYEQGVGAQGAQLDWYCSWASYGLAHRSQQALAKLDALTTMSVWSQIDDNGHALFTGIQRGIVAGDLEPLRDYVQTNCADA